MKTIIACLLAIGASALFPQFVVLFLVLLILFAAGDIHGSP
jgi:hypothetical protein